MELCSVRATLNKLGSSVSLATVHILKSVSDGGSFEHLSKWSAIFVKFVIFETKIAVPRSSPMRSSNLEVVFQTLKKRGYTIQVEGVRALIWDCT